LLSQEAISESIPSFWIGFIYCRIEMGPDRKVQVITETDDADEENQDNKLGIGKKPPIHQQREDNKGWQNQNSPEVQSHTQGKQIADQDETISTSWLTPPLTPPHYQPGGESHDKGTR